MDEYSIATDEVVNAGPRLAVANISENPVQGARAVQLAQATGVPAPVIHGDLAGFEEENKAAMAANIVRGNSYLSRYIRDEAMGSIVSNDDYGNLAKFSEGAQRTSMFHRTWAVPTAAVVGAAEGAVKGIGEGWGPGSLSEKTGAESIDRLMADKWNISGNIYKGMYFAFQLGEKAMGAMFKGTTGLVAGAATEAYAEMFGRNSEELPWNSPYGAESFGKAIAGGVEGRMLSGEHAGTTTGLAKSVIKIDEAQKVKEAESKFGEFMDAARLASPYLKDGMEPPTGLHPLIDKVKGEANAKALESLENDLANAQEAFTKERSPELFKKFADEHFGGSTIGITADRVVELYKDKIPEPGDGMLGWVPGIEAKLEAARLTGDDVHIPISDWVTHVDPALAKGLREDIRMWPGGITARETIAPIEPRAVVDSPLAQVRDGAGLEPAFAIGDRKVTLAKDGEPYIFKRNDAIDPGIQPNENLQMDFINFHDQNGNVVGDMSVVPDPTTKTLVVQMVGGSYGLNANSFGPSLVRDMIRQLKAMYPEYTTITGHRVTGARDAANATDRELAFPKVKLDEAPSGWDIAGAADTFNDFKKILEQGYLKQYSQTIWAHERDPALLSAEHKALDQAARAEIAKMTGGGVGFRTVDKVVAEGAANPLGVYMGFGQRAPQILIGLFSPDVIGATRHEGIHFLRKMGFFDAAEWKVLEETAKREGWEAIHGIDERYNSLRPEAKLEEAIAEQYRAWSHLKDQGVAPDTAIGKLFQKMYDLWEGIKTQFKELTGQDLTSKEIFDKIFSGEMGQRTGREPLNPRQFTGADRAHEPAFSMPETEKMIQDRLAQLRAESAGLDKKSWGKIQELIKERFAEDIEASIKRAEREQKKEQTVEWKANYAAVRNDVSETIRQRPDVMADLFFGSGELDGKKLRKEYSLRAEDLTPEQIAALPKRYVSKEGLPLDDTARLFGFTSGDAMIEALSDYNKSKEGRTAQEMVKDAVDQETKRQMELRYGDLETNIMREAQDQALSETNLNILAEEYHAAGMQAGIEVIDKKVAQAEAKRAFGQMEMKNVNTQRMLALMNKLSRDIERDLLGEKPQDALIKMQQKYVLALTAAEARKVEKELGQFERTAKRYASREISSTSPEYVNFIHQILLQTGNRVKRSVQDLAEQISHGESKNLQEFVQNKTDMLREIPVPDYLYDASWAKEIKELTTEEFREVHGAIKALVWNGRDELKLVKAGEAADLKVIKDQMIDLLSRFAERKYDAKGMPIDSKLQHLPIKLQKAMRSYYAGSLQLETVLNHWDKFDPKGVWNQYIMRDLIDGANQVDAWKKEYAKKLHELDDKVDLKKTIDNPLFRDPNSGALFGLNRENLRAVMLNVGTDSNLRKMAEGYKLKPEQVMAWVHQHATKEDWVFVQKVWDNIFKDIKEKSDTMYRSLTGGVAAEDIPAVAIDTKFGKFDGGYYPIIHHAEFEGASKRMMGKDALEQEGFVRATTPSGYTKKRTGYVAPMALDLDAMPVRISQMLHDVGLRPAVLNASKIFYDKDVRGAIQKHYGTEYRDQLVPYLQAVANASNRMDRTAGPLNALSEFFRQNTITTLIGLNPGTVMKHGPSALVSSMREVGITDFGNAVKSLFSINETTGESNWQFAMKHSLELQRRDRNWQESLYGATNELSYGSKLTPLRQKIIEFSSKPVAMSDMLSAVPTWLAAYSKEMGESGIHGDAIYAADRSVRRAHGSTATTNRPAIMRNTSPWLTSVYNYFNDIMNRQMETLWKAGEAVDMYKQGDKVDAMKAVPALTASLFAYLIWPSIVESFVSPHEHKDGDSWAKKAGTSLLFTAGASWIGLRELTGALTSGRDPQAGMLGTAGREITDLVRDLNKKDSLNREHRGKVIQSGIAFLGQTTGMAPLQVGKAIRFITDANSGVVRPEGPWAWAVGLRHGTTKNHPTTFNKYMQGKVH